MSQSGHERLLIFQVKVAKLPAPTAQYRFAPPRRWTFDLAWPDRQLCCEVEGGHWNRGRHTRGLGFEADCEKYAEAVIRGWKVLRVTTTMVKDGRALNLIERALAAVADAERAS